MFCKSVTVRNEIAIMKECCEPRVLGTGWLLSTPDMRDYTSETPAIAEILSALGIDPNSPPNGKDLPNRMDLRAGCSPVEDQGELGSCTANAAVGVVEYLEKKGNGRYLDGSRLFVYKTTRDLMGQVGDTGASLSATMSALVLFGVPPERYWPYVEKKAGGKGFDEEPPAFVYAMADDFRSLKYWCHDPWANSKPKADVLLEVKTYLAAGIPSMFGFFGFASSFLSNVKGGIAYPDRSEKAEWGHAVVAVGYDDDIEITNTKNKRTTKGALLFRNSWGAGWGEEGYGWIPYDYVLNELASDFWSIMSMDYVDTLQFGLKI